MKAAILITDTRTQIVLTPESPIEKAALEQIEKSAKPPHITRGSFYECRGGWTRQGSGDESLIIVVQPQAHDQLEEAEQSGADTGTAEQSRSA